MMASGGARARSGPAPDPKALRRERDGGEWTTIPAVRDGEAPDWPLTVDPSGAERILWDRLWSDGRAVEWERQRLELAVANFVRVQAAAEKLDAATNLRTLAKQLAEDLGLTAGGMLRNKWRFGEPEQPKPKRRRSSSRARLSVVNDDGD